MGFDFSGQLSSYSSRYKDSILLSLPNQKTKDFLFFLRNPIYSRLMNIIINFALKLTSFSRVKQDIEKSKH